MKTKKQIWKEECEETNQQICNILLPVFHEISEAKKIANLRTCSATVYESYSGRWLKSYNTFVAYIDFASGIGIDFLRGIYGYTSTSCQHISKFFHDYGAQKRLTYVDVSVNETADKIFSKIAKY